MKYSIMLFILFSSICYGFQCPAYSDFYQDADHVWHLANLPPAPDGSYWEPFTQGPLAPKTHKVNSIEVELTYGTYPDHVYCDYGKDGNVFMGIRLHTNENQKPKPGPGASYDDRICKKSPEICTFDLT